MKLLTYGSQSPKIAKSDKSGLGYLSAIIYLSPWKLSGHNVCAFASLGCRLSCLNTAGRGRTNIVQQSRLNKTNYLFDNTKGFMDQLYKEIEAFTKKCAKLKQKPAIRLNGTSDLDWRKFRRTIYNDWPTVQFYDYTKNYAKCRMWLDGQFSKNYHLTYSRSETNQEHCFDLLARGCNVAIVFRKDIPEKYWGYSVFDADENDLRFLDKFGIQGLKAKGKAKKDKTGFVVDL